MQFRCEVIARNLLPVFRALVAKELVETYGLSQVEAANRLGITQAAVSQYLCSKRGRRSIEPSYLTERVKKTAKRAAAEISKKKIPAGDVMGMACDLCAQMGTRPYAKKI